ncbi:CRAL/TRIO domain-containing protein [Rhizoctonia solani AG-1 IA]|uniref:CRAL/TRIO domain-containing protein n=1 Tax=Thanatephorus cucumeris (strain AG1-IA) TaxID=983506 RepID=L8WRK8_THACA|nr:CRAL/TRIO domain-containing protein [Rhizoctonia solani AG-1 IA]
MPVHVTSLPPSPPEINPAPTLNEEQSNVYGIVLKHYSSPAYVIPGVDAQKATLTEEEKQWLVLRASKWVLATTITRLDDTLKWRREYGLYELITPNHVEPEAVTGKEILAGYDLERRPALYMMPSKQNTEESPRQLQFAVWMLERAVDLMGPGVENLDILINFADRGKNPSLSTSKNVSICRCIMANHQVLKICVVTRAKVKFNPEIIKEGLFDKSQATKEWGGEMKSWKPLVDLCNNLHTERKERWRKLGGTVGLSEWDIKGGAPQPELQPAMTNGTNLIPDSKSTVSRKDIPESKILRLACLDQTSILFGHYQIIMRFQLSACDITISGSDTYLNLRAPFRTPSPGDKPIIAVCGATGIQGGSVVKHLLRDGRFSVRALTRKPTSFRAKGCYGAFGITDYYEAFDEEGQHGINIIDAAKATKLKHLVMR